MKKNLVKLLVAGTIGISTMFSVPAKAADFLRSYPFSFWGEARSDNSKTVITGRFEQGVEVLKLDKWGLVPFVAFGASYDSNKAEYWNNETVPEIGVKLTHPLKLTKDGWGNVSVGLRQRWEVYFDSPVPNISRTEIFLQLGFGGDWQ